MNTDFPYLCTSPDGIVNGSCWGVGCLEIKCPSKYRNNLIDDIWYLEFGNGGAVEIIKTHAYYYQIQTQLLVTQYDYWDFFVIFINDFVCIRIEPDKELFWENLKKMQTFLWESHITRTSVKIF